MPSSIPDFFALSPWKNPPAVERIMELIWQLQDECEQQTWVDHWHEDEPHCPCLFCEHSGGLWHYLRLIEAVFEGQVYTFPALCRRRAARAREAGNPVDLQSAERWEARAAELERTAAKPTCPPPAAGPPATLALLALMKEAKAGVRNPFIREA